MNILITGVNGFLGTGAARRLRQQGHRVGGLIRPGAVMPQALVGVPVWMIDEEENCFTRALADFRPDVVVHLAALFVAEHRPEDVVPLVRANLEYGVRLLDAMRETGCQSLVFAGTSWQHYHDREYCPVNLYAATKQAFSTIAEYYLDAAGLRMVELHLYDSYGEDDSRKKLMNLLRFYAKSADELAMSEGEQRIHLVHIDDLSRGVAMACDVACAVPVGTRRVYRLPSAGAVSLRELVALFNSVDPTHPVAVRWGERPYRQREVFNPWESAEVLPGWGPEIPLEEGLRRVRRMVASSELVKGHADNE